MAAPARLRDAGPGRDRGAPSTRSTPALAARGERLECAQRPRLSLAVPLTAVSAASAGEGRNAAQDQPLQQTGTPTTSWLTVQGGLSKREAAGLLHQAKDLAEHPDIAQAAAAGRISVNQARAISACRRVWTESN